MQIEKQLVIKEPAKENPSKPGEPSAGTAWRIVLGEWAKPFPLLLTIASVTLMIAQALLPAGAIFLNIVLLVMIAVLSGIVGSQLYERWKQANEQGILASKGRSASRGLNLILRQLRGIEVLSGDYQALNSMASGKNDAFPISSILGEIRRSVDSVSLQVVAAIEEWEDIVPDAKNFQTRIDTFDETNEQLKRQKAIVGQLQGSLSEERQLRNTERLATAEAAEESRVNIANLESNLSVAMDEVIRLQKEVSSQRSTLGTAIPTIDSISYIGGYNPINLPNPNKATSAWDKPSFGPVSSGKDE
jgi:hypothetical protein